MKDFTLKQCKYTILPKTRWHSLEPPPPLRWGRFTYNFVGQYSLPYRKIADIYVILY